MFWGGEGPTGGQLSLVKWYSPSLPLPCLASLLHDSLLAFCGKPVGVDASSGIKHRASGIRQSGVLGLPVHAGGGLVLDDGQRTGPAAASACRQCYCHRRPGHRNSQVSHTCVHPSLQALSTHAVPGQGHLHSLLSPHILSCLRLLKPLSLFMSLFGPLSHVAHTLATDAFVGQA